MKAVLYKIGEKAQVVEIDNNYKTYKKYIGGWAIDLRIANDYLVLCDEDGTPKRRSLNAHVKLPNKAYYPIVGDFLVCKCVDNEIAGLTDEEINKLLESDLIKQVKGEQ